MKTTKEAIRHLNFQTMPRDQGQIVEVSYAVDEEGVWCRSYDRSDRTASYLFATYSKQASERDLAFEPQNGKLPRHNYWRNVVAS